MAISIKPEDIHMVFEPTKDVPDLYIRSILTQAEALTLREFAINQFRILTDKSRGELEKEYDTIYSDMKDKLLSNFLKERDIK